MPTSSRLVVLFLLVAGALPGAGPVAVSAASSGPLSSQRDRLFREWAVRRGQGADVCAAWRSMGTSRAGQSQQGVFLTITHRLWEATVRASGRRALSHVTAVYALQGEKSLGECGGADYNRLFLAMDDTLKEALIQAARGDRLALDVLDNADTWRESHDWAGPHWPFDASAETELGAPRAQAHFFKYPDAVFDCRPYWTPPCIGDPNMLEVDQDYNFVHDSSTECWYGSESGRQMYARGHPGVDYGWQPSDCVDSPPTCPNGWCDEGIEDCSICPSDCGCPEGTSCESTASETHACAPAGCGADEDCPPGSYCASGVCAPVCGDGACTPGWEDCANCALDCAYTPVFTVSTSEAVVGQEVTFTAEPRLIVDPPAPLWDLGNAVHRAGNPLAYAYPAPGTYTVVLTATESNCQTESLSLPQTINVCLQTRCPANSCGWQPDGCGAEQWCGDCLPSCGAMGGDYCSGSGSCPGGYDSLGPSDDCDPCCKAGPSCGAMGGDFCSGSGFCPYGYDPIGQSYDCNPCCKSQPPPCQSEGCSPGGCGWQTDNCGDSIWCGSCLPSCGAMGGDFCSQSGSCPGGYDSLGQSNDCNPCCKSQPPPPCQSEGCWQGSCGWQTDNCGESIWCGDCLPSCGAMGGDYCSQSGSCPGGYDSLGQSNDCNPCCKSQPPPPCQSEGCWQGSCGWQTDNCGESLWCGECVP